MRRSVFVILIGLAVFVGLATYAASPFLAAWSLREAIRQGHIETIDRRVAWDSVRTSLKASIVRHAELVPVVTETGRRIRPTLWQRIKRVFGASMIDRFIETKITAAGLHKLYVTRTNRAVRRAVAAARTPMRAGAGASPATDWRQQLRSFMSRLAHARFVDLTTVEIQVADRYHKDRHYLGRLELIGLTWMLTRLEVVKPRPSGTRA